MTSLTGGGGLSSSSSSSVDGDNTFSNAFNYNSSNQQGSNNQIMIVGAIVLIVLYMGRK